MEDASRSDPSAALSLHADALAAIVDKKATCPFIGSAVAMGRLPVRNDPTNPLAGIEDVRRLGNSGGGNLGDLLVLFASGNHAFMRGASGRLDCAVPADLFSLEFPGSQGSHPGHSGILQGDPKQLDSGRLSLPDFERLAGRAVNGAIKRSQVGGFIAENLHRDPESKVFSASVARLIAGDLAQAAARAGAELLTRLREPADTVAARHRELEEKLTKLVGDDNFAGACGEYGLLFAFLAHRPGAPEVDGEPALRLEDLRAMFVDKRFPEGWESWKKTRLDWIVNTAALAMSAGKAYLALRRA